MKVVHVVRQYLPSVGGMEEVVRSLAASQRDGREVEPEIVTLDRVFRDPAVPLPRQDEIEGVKVTRLGYRGSERYPLAPAVLRSIADADLVHVHGVDFFFDYLAATRWLHGKPLVASTHGGFFHTAFASRLKQAYFNTVTRLSALAYGRIIATSENDGDIFRRVVAKERLTVIENGVDVTKFRDAGPTQSRPVLIYFGRWSANKGLLEAVDLFARLRARDAARDWRLIVAGREYDLSQADIAAHAARRGVAEQVEIHANPSQPALCELIGQASYFVCLSHHEGFGIAPIEAMSAGLTPLLSNIPPFRRLVARTGCGLLADAADPDDTVQRLLALHDQQAADHAALRRRNMDTVAVYDWPGVAQQYLAAYRAATERPARSTGTAGAENDGVREDG